MIKELKPGWHLEAHDEVFFSEMGKLSLLFLHTLLDRLYERCEKQLQWLLADFPEEEVAAHWETTAWHPSHRGELPNGFFVPPLMFSNFQQVRGIVEQKEEEVYWRLQKQRGEGCA